MITRILHFSDTHAQSEALARIQSLAMRLIDIEVVAHTGDVLSNNTHYAPLAWNNWPHKVKLSVPGSHDHPTAYNPLTTWNYRPPWYYLVDQLLFVGIDTSQGIGYLRSLESLSPQLGTINFSALVILTHEWFHRPTGNKRFVDEIGDLVLGISKGRPVLVLHGHDHAESVTGLVWDDHTRAGDLTCFRSNVCSSPAHAAKGVAHLVTWDGHTFSCEPNKG